MILFVLIQLNATVTYLKPHFFTVSRASGSIGNVTQRNRAQSLSANLSIGMGVDTTNKWAYINCAQSGGIRPLYLNSNGNGSVYITGTLFYGALSAISDSRIKKNIVDINDNIALSILRQIKPKTRTEKSQWIVPCFS
jgi:hypothetical protein